uniref:Uncharacterized protein n=1 Tax=Oryza barthii TaxID=65489 RepID=A0A0D3FCZ1_9ORYZ
MLSQQEDGEGKSSKKDGSSSAGGGGSGRRRLSRSGGAERRRLEPRRRLGRHRREGGEVVGGGRQVGAVGHGHVDGQPLALPAVSRRGADTRPGVVRLKTELPSSSFSTGSDAWQAANATGVTCTTESWLGGYRNPA